MGDAIGSGDVGQGFARLAASKRLLSLIGVEDRRTAQMKTSGLGAPSALASSRPDQLKFKIRKAALTRVSRPSEAAVSA